MSDFSKLTKIFGQDVARFRREMQEEGETFTYGGAAQDMLVMSWDEHHNPVEEFKERGYYTYMKTLVSSGRVSGTMYRGTDWDCSHLKVGEKIDYSNRLTTWSRKIEQATDFCDPERPILLKLTCQSAPGLDVNRDVVLDETRLTVTEKTSLEDGVMFTVELT